MRRIFFGRNLILLLCILFACGCAATKTTAKSVPTSPTPKPVIHPETHPEVHPETHPETLYVTSDQLNLRVCPSLNCKVTAVLKRGDEVVKLGQKEDWINVRTKAANREGWVASQLVGKMPTKKKTPSRVKEKPSPREKEKKAASGLEEEFAP